jgi:hypothetical protein
MLYPLDRLPLEINDRKQYVLDLPMLRLGGWRIIAKAVHMLQLISTGMSAEDAIEWVDRKPMDSTTRKNFVTMAEYMVAHMTFDFGAHNFQRLSNIEHLAFESARLPKPEYIKVITRTVENKHIWTLEEPEY